LSANPPGAQPFSRKIFSSTLPVKIGKNEAGANSRFLSSHVQFLLRILPSLQRERVLRCRNLISIVDDISADMGTDFKHNPATISELNGYVQQGFILYNITWCILWPCPFMSGAPAFAKTLDVNTIAAATAIIIYFVGDSFRSP
jgi:hypothetical protein